MRKTVVALFLFMLSFSAFTQWTQIPDRNFEQWLIDLAWDTPPIDGRARTSTLGAIHQVAISGKGITDLTGIEAFTSMDYFRGNGNSFDTIDFTNSPDLDYFSCVGCGIESLFLGNNTALETIIFDDNEVSQFIVPFSIGLRTISCRNNNLSVLDMTGMDYVTRVHCDSNNIRKLDLSGKRGMQTLTCTSNNLVQLNLKTTAGFTWLNDIETSGNPNLVCIEVDDSLAYDFYENHNRFHVDSTTSFSLNCQYGLGLSEDVEDEQLNVFPNPSSRKFEIHWGSGSLKEMKITNVQGQQIPFELSESAVDLIHAPAGLYFISVRTSEGLRSSRVQIE